MAIYLIFVIYMQQRYSYAKIAKNHATYLIDYRRKVGVSIDAQEGYIHCAVCIINVASYISIISCVFS